MPLPTFALPHRPKQLRSDLQPVENPVFAFHDEQEGGLIEMFGVVGLDITVGRVAGALRQNGQRPITVQLNSGGGDYFDGAAIYNLLRAYGQTVRVEILGVAGSAASIIAMAGDKIAMARSASMMIHKTWAIAAGSDDDLRALADLLQKLDATSAEVYAARTGQKVTRIREMVAAETWMNADEAVGWGFADVILDEEGLPPPQQAGRHAPSSKQQLEGLLRQHGLSKSQAKRAASAGWRAMGDETDSEIDFEQVAARIAATTDAIRHRRF